MNEHNPSHSRVRFASLLVNSATLLMFPASMMAIAFAAPVEFVGSRVMLPPAFAVPAAAVVGLLAHFFRARLPKQTLWLSVGGALIGLVWYVYVLFALYMFSRGITAG